MNNIFAFSSFLTFLGSWLLGIAVFVKNPKLPATRSFLLMCLSVGGWALCLSLKVLAVDKETAMFSSRLLYLFSLFIPISFFDFILDLLEIKERNKAVRKWFFVFIVIFLPFLFTPWFIRDLVPKASFRFWDVPGFLYPIFILYYASCTTLSFYEIFVQYKSLSSVKRNQMNYVMISAAIGFFGGFTTFLPVFDIPIFPFGIYFIFLYLAVGAHVIVRHHLMDIRLAVTKAGIFFAVFALTLGIPFWIGYQTKSWLMATAFMAILATAGPIAHRLLQRKVEAILQKEQLSMRRALREFAGQVTQIKDFDTLYRETLNKTYEIVKPEFAGLYVYSERQSYVLQHDLSDKEYPAYTEFMASHNLMIAMAQDRKPVFLETVKGMPQALHESIALPFYEGFKQKGVLCFLLLGPKKNKALYDHMDLDLFEILEAQVSLALENLSLLQDRELRILEEQRLSKMVIIGDIGTGVAHQVNNRFNSMLTLLRMHFDLYKETDLNALSCEQLRERYAAALSDMKDIHDESLNGFKIAEAMLASAREPIDPQPFKIEYALHLALDLLRAKKNLKRITIIEDIPHDNPCVWASTACTQDVFYNLVDNGADADEDKIHAVASGKLESKEDSYQPKVIIRARVVENNLMLVEVEDNGIGIEEKHMESVGQPCYSTKAGKKMGTGYGVATVRKLLAQSNSKLEIRSIYGKGSVFSFTLPLATKEQIEEHERQKPKKD